MLYNFEIPTDQTQLRMIEWFLKKNSVSAATVGAVTPVDG